MQVSVGKHAYGVCGRFAGTAEERLEDLNAAFADASVDVILCSRGGYGLQQIVDKIVLPTRPKSTWPLVVGFSDITALHAVMSLHGVPSLHASMCKALATLDEESPVLGMMREALEKGKSFQNFNSSRLDGYETIKEQLRGRRVIGGNLSVLYGLQGTPYSLHAIIDQCAEAPVLLIEDISERHYHVDRMLNNLRLSGVFDRLGGVIVGQFTDCDDDPKMGTTLRGTIINTLAKYDYPTVMDAPIGHVDGNYPIVLS
jgi:muramoyltetrapeptide carboxypeptidase